MVAATSMASENASSSRRRIKKRKSATGAASLPSQMTSGVKLTSIHSLREARTTSSGASPPTRPDADPSTSASFSLRTKKPTQRTKSATDSDAERAHQRAYAWLGDVGDQRAGRT